MRIVVVGGGLAAASAVTELREQGHDGSVTVLAGESHLPYERPPLSKGLLLGDSTEEAARVHDQQWYDDHDVALHLGSPVTGLDLDRARVAAGDHSFPYDRLLLATGARPRRLELADASGAPTAYLRTLEDSRRLLESLTPGRGLLILGGGWIGLEVAAAARTRGADVTIVEPRELPLLAVLGPEVATRFADLHRGHGVDLRLGTGVAGIAPRPDGGARVRIDDGSDVDADLVVVAIGVEPEDGLAREAGLDVDNGILVDARLRTSDPAVFAIGDVANHEHPALGRRIRVEHWDTAIHQGRAAARVMLGGDEPYTRLPYFFTDQYDLGMEYVGSVAPGGGEDVVLREAEGASTFTAFWLSGDRVDAGMHVNDWDAIDDIRALVGSRVDRARLADPDVPLADLRGRRVS
ncbi:MAG: NAD(P)/FAD-dependent oxidoreductase [Nocardioides sp.]